jgi:hypothetical protein
MSGWLYGGSGGGEDASGGERGEICRLSEPAEGIVDQALIALESTIHAEGLNPGMIEALAGIDRLQCAEEHACQSLGRNMVRDPRPALSIEEMGNALRGWQGNDRKTSGRGLEEGVGQSFMARREDEKGGAGEPGLRVENVSREANRGSEAKRAAHGLQSRFFGTIADDGQIGARILESEGGERCEEEVESFFAGEPADGEQVRSWAGPVV